jgi:hypothetical protein
MLTSVAPPMLSGMEPGENWDGDSQPLDALGEGILIGPEVLGGTRVVVELALVQSPKSGWQPTPQKSGPVPQKRNSEQQAPKTLPKHDTPLPQVPSFEIKVQ